MQSETAEKISFKSVTKKSEEQEDEEEEEINFEDI
jgi:hypothetical protein